MWQGDKDVYKKLENIRSWLAFRMNVMTLSDMNKLSAIRNARFNGFDNKTAAIVTKLAQDTGKTSSRLLTNTSEIPREISKDQNDAASERLRLDYRQDAHCFPQIVAQGHARLHLGDVHYHNADIGHRQDQSDQLARELQKDTLAAVHRLQSPFSANFSSREPSPRGQRQEEMKPEDATTTLLNMLRFRQMTARQEEVEDAHIGTFRWLLEEKRRAHQRALFSPLLPWLETGQGCYWISGKAGSGKSTCMKYLSSSPILKRAISSWAGSHQLIDACFYFWRGGTPLQRTQEGLFKIPPTFHSFTEE